MPLERPPACDRRATGVRRVRSLKYEAVYLHDPEDGFKAQRVIGEWMEGREATAAVGKLSSLYDLG